MSGEKTVPANQGTTSNNSAQPTESSNQSQSSSQGNAGAAPPQVSSPALTSEGPSNNESQHYMGASSKQAADINNNSSPSSKNENRISELEGRVEDLERELAAQEEKRQQELARQQEERQKRGERLEQARKDAMKRLEESQAESRQRWEQRRSGTYSRNTQSQVRGNESPGSAGVAPSQATSPTSGGSRDGASQGNTPVEPAQSANRSDNASPSNNTENQGELGANSPQPTNQAKEVDPATQELAAKVDEGFNNLNRNFDRMREGVRQSLNRLEGNIENLGNAAENFFATNEQNNSPSSTQQPTRSTNPTNTIISSASNIESTKTASSQQQANDANLNSTSNINNRSPNIPSSFNRWLNGEARPEITQRVLKKIVSDAESNNDDYRVFRLTKNSPPHVPRGTVCCTVEGRLTYNNLANFAQNYTQQNNNSVMLEMTPDKSTELEFESQESFLNFLRIMLSSSQILEGLLKGCEITTATTRLTIDRNNDNLITVTNIIQQINMPK